MPTNDYKPFAYGGAANVETPAAWAADGVRTLGFVSGVAPSQKLNTAWRQASVGVAALAQFCVDLTGVSLADDGSVATFEAALTAGLLQFIVNQFALGRVPVISKNNALTNSAGVVNIDFALGNMFTYVMTANCTNLTFSNIPGAGFMEEVTVDFVGDGTDHGHSFLLGALLKWLGVGAFGTAPTFVYTSGAKNTVVFKAGEAVTSAISASYSGTSAG